MSKKITIDTPNLEGMMIDEYNKKDNEFFKYCEHYMKEHRHKISSIEDCVKHLMVKYYYIYLQDKDRDKILFVNKED